MSKDEDGEPPIPIDLEALAQELRNWRPSRWERIKMAWAFLRHRL